MNYLTYCTHKNLADVYYKLEEFDFSLRYYLRSLRWIEADVAGWIHVGLSAMKVKKWWLARSAFERSLKVSPFLSEN
jgi:hypothetical protein